MTSSPVADSRRAWSLTAATAAAILVASVVRLPGDAAVGSGVVGVTDPFHLVGYAALAAAVANALATNPGDGTAGAGAAAKGVAGAGTHRELRPKLLVVAVVLATLFGVGVEVVQAPLPWRSLAAVDAAVNLLGAVLGVVGFRAWHRWRERREVRTSGR